MQGQINTKLGNISIDADVIAVYAGSVALGCRTSREVLRWRSKITRFIWHFT